MKWEAEPDPCETCSGDCLKCCEQGRHDWRVWQEDRDCFTRTLPKLECCRCGLTASPWCISGGGPGATRFDVHYALDRAPERNEGA